MAATTPSAADRARFAEAIAPRAEGTAAAAQQTEPSNLRIAGDVAEVRIEGVLTQEPDFWLWLFGYANTAYSDIRRALASAEANPSVRRLSLFVDSPGGDVDGLFDTIAAIEGSSKPKSVRAAYACSAAYALAAVGGNIEATNEAATFGSVGVVASFRVNAAIVEVTSTEAPDKRPDPTTDAGKAVIREYLDSVHELFAQAIARGRGTSLGTVNAEFGRGAVMIASEAQRRGMIDSISKPAVRRSSATAIAPGHVAQAQTKAEASAPGVARRKEIRMNEQELKAQYPGLYDLVLNKGKAEGQAEGELLGVKKERDRVGAHVTLGFQSGDLETMRTALLDGSPLTQTVQAKYMAASMNRRDQNARQQDDATAASATSGAEKPKAKDLGDMVADILAGDRGNT